MANIAGYIGFVASGQVGFPPGQALTRTVTFPTAVAVGDTILVWVTESNGGVAGGANTVSDNVNAGNYTLLKQVDDTGGQASWYLYGKFNSGAATAGNFTVTVVFPVLIWHGVFAMDVTGVVASPLITAAIGNVQAGVGTGANAITTGNIAAGSGSAIVIAGTINTTTQAVTNSGAPTAGTSPVYTFYISDDNWNTSGTPGTGPEGTPDRTNCTFEFLTSSNPGTLSATFTAFSGDTGDTYASIVVALQASINIASIGWV